MHGGGGLEVGMRWKVGSEVMIDNSAWPLSEHVRIICGS